MVDELAHSVEATPAGAVDPAMPAAVRTGAHPRGPADGVALPADRQRRALGDLRQLKWLGVALPIVILAGIEAFRYVFVEDSPIHRAEHVAIAAVTAIGIVAFALFMFTLIERAERQIVRQNRELTAINAVSTAVQGELAVDQIIDAALQTVIARTHATEASVVVFAHEGKPDSGLERKVVRLQHASAGAMGSSAPHLIDIPLARGTAIVGRMRLHLPEGSADPDLLASATLQNIGHQLACSIQIGQLVGDLQRRRLEGHGLYDVLLRISNQGSLAETLGAVVRHARDLLNANDAVICLSSATSALFDGSEGRPARLADGSTCISADPDRFSALDDRPLACPVGSPSDKEASMHVPLTSPGLNLGELWVVRAPDAPFTARDRAFLQTLGELAAIAITSARMRENEHQGAILAERERIAREMHDSLAQVLGVVHLRLRALGTNAELLAAPGVISSLADLADLAEEAYRDVRESILGLRESSRAERGLFDSLRAYLEKFGRQSGIDATLEAVFDEEPRLPPRAEVQVIRVIQEALTNVRKHAKASKAVVRVTFADGAVSFRIEDDGRGFDLAGTLLDRDSRFGLQTMRERMELIGGTLTIDSAPGRGTRLVARVPGVSGASPLSSEVNGGHRRVQPDRSERIRPDPDLARR
jgi:two-component system nitrate/nitrite sensor histidine kinase NarX